MVGEAGHVGREDGVRHHTAPVDQLEQPLLVDREVHRLTYTDPVERRQLAVEAEVLGTQRRALEQQGAVARVLHDAVELGRRMPAMSISPRWYLNQASWALTPITRSIASRYGSPGRK